VLFLGQDIHLAFFGLVALGLFLVEFILDKHFFKVVSLLFALVGLKRSLGFHFLAQAVNQVHLLAEGMLLILSAFALLLK
jgi:hypothetical protein